MKNWNFGIIGAGLIAEFHAKAIQDIENAHLIGFCDGGSGRAKKLAEQFNCKAFSDYQAMVNSSDINIVTIATPSGFHMEPAIAAANNNKHVICEKPLEINLERIDKMIAAHEMKGTYLGGIFNYRFNESIQPLKKAIKENRFGKMTYAAVYVPWWRSDEYYAGNWRGTWKLDGGGALMNQSIHMIDMLQYLAGPVESLQAYTKTLGHTIETEDSAVAILNLKNKALGVIHGTTASYPGQFRRLEIMGTKGSVIMVEDGFTVWDFAEKQPGDDEVLKKYSQKESGGGVSDPGAINYKNHYLNIKSFLEAIENNKKFEIDGFEARKAVKIIRAIYEASKERKEVIL